MAKPETWFVGLVLLISGLWIHQWRKELIEAVITAREEANPTEGKESGEAQTVVSGLTDASAEIALLRKEIEPAMGAAHAMARLGWIAESRKALKEIKQHLDSVWETYKSEMQTPDGPTFRRALLDTRRNALQKVDEIRPGMQHLLTRYDPKVAYNHVAGEESVPDGRRNYFRIETLQTVDADNYFNQAFEWLDREEAGAKSTLRAVGSKSS